MHGASSLAIRNRNEIKIEIEHINFILFITVSVDRLVLY